MSGTRSAACLARRLAWRLALRGVPRHLRDGVEGDLLETGAGHREAWALALHFQAEPYREAAHRQAAAALLLAGALLLWTLPMAAQTLLAQAAALGNGLAASAAAWWGAPAVLAAAAAGLLLGRASLLPTEADAMRLHLVLALWPLATGLAPTAAQAWAAALLLPAAAWLGHRNRGPAPEAAPPG
jgi:hypothetical protein